MTFNTSLTDNGSGSGGNSIASFLLGYPQQVSRVVSLFYPHYNTKEPFAFVQDDWHATSNLTLNLGLRYDVFTPYTEQDNNLVNVNLATSTILVAGKNGVSRTANITTDHSNLAPRLGFSATLPRQLVVRGGTGLSLLPRQLHVAVVPQERAVHEHVWSGHQRRRIGRPAEPAPEQRASAAGGDRHHRADRHVPGRAARLQEHAHAAVQPVRRKGNRGERDRRRLSGMAAGSPHAYLGNVDLAPAAAGGIQARRAYAATLPNVSAIPLIASDYEGTYDAMQLVFQRRQRNGLTMSANYTLAHAVVTNASPWDVTVVERYDSDFDVRHRVVLSANYELPLLKTAGPVTRGLLGGWQINGVAFWQTGTPYTIANGTARSNTGGTDRPNQIGDPTLSNPTVAQWFNVAAFAAADDQHGRQHRPQYPARPAPAARRPLAVQERGAQQHGAVAAAGGGVQRHEHPELPEPERQLRDRRVRQHHQHGQRHRPADAVRGQAAVLG